MAPKRRREEEEEVAVEAVNAVYDLENSNAPTATPAAKIKSKSKKLKQAATDVENDAAADAEVVGTEGKRLSKKQLKALEKKAKKEKEISEKDAIKDAERAQREKEEAEKKEEKKGEKKEEETEELDKIIKVGEEEEKEGDEGEGEGKEEDRPKKKNEKFIVFVGNLPFTAKEEHLRTHFASLSPFTIRLLTHKTDPTKSRGIAFLEFTHWRPMRTCLDKFHHSLFTDGESPPRRINIELTAGGGGNTVHRTAKIKVKNDKLKVSRLRRIQREDEEKKGKTEKEVSQAAQDGMHPARLAQIQNGGAGGDDWEERQGTRRGFGGRKGRGDRGRGGGRRGGRGGFNRRSGGDSDGRNFKRQRR